MKDLAKIRGDLQITVRRALDDVILRRFAIRNQITYNGINSPIFLWSQDGIVVTDFRITSLVAGSGTTPPTKGDIALAIPIGPGVITLGATNRTQSPATAELIITADWPAPSAVDGFSLSEVGLVLGNGQLFARQVHPTIAKTSLITVSYSWRLALTA